MKQDSGLAFRRGGYVARYAEGPQDMIAAQRLRHLCFIDIAGLPARPGGRDSDGFDSICRHVLIEDAGTRALVCCFRLLALPDGASIGDSYAAQYYDLTLLQRFAAPMAEIGRFCIHPEVQDADVLRVAWGALTRFVDAGRVELLFGCSSFAGTDAARYVDAFAMLQDRHLAPAEWSPAVRAAQALRFADLLHGHKADTRAGIAAMPPLLRSYLSMGGWVSDHAVVDHDLNTLHVFTGLQTRTVPAARARALRAVAG